MKIISTITTRALAAQHGGFDATDRMIRTEAAILWITTYDGMPDRWFVTYELNDRNVLRIVDRMDRHVWSEVWSEFRRLQH